MAFLLQGYQILFYLFQFDFQPLFGDTFSLSSSQTSLFLIFWLFSYSILIPNFVYQLKHVNIIYLIIMFKRGAPFQIPQIHGSKKIMPQVSPVKNVPSQKRQDNFQLKPMQVGISSPSTFDQRFCFQLDEPIQTDQSVYWQYQLTNQVAGQYLRKLIFRQMHFVSRSLTQNQIAQTIFIEAQGVVGYRNKLGVSTNRVCALHLCQTQATLDDTDTKVYDLLYKQIQDVAWDVPSNLSTIKLKIQFDNVQKTGSLNIPLICQFDIRHSGK